MRYPMFVHYAQNYRQMPHRRCCLLAAKIPRLLTRSTVPLDQRSRYILRMCAVSIFVGLPGVATGSSEGICRQTSFSKIPSREKEHRPGPSLGLCGMADASLMWLAPGVPNAVLSVVYDIQVIWLFFYWKTIFSLFGAGFWSLVGTRSCPVKASDFCCQGSIFLIRKTPFLH